MVVLSRKAGQQFEISEDIAVTVLAVHGRTVRPGIDAPRKILFMRLELRKAMPATTTDVFVPVVNAIQRPAGGN